MTPAAGLRPGLRREETVRVDEPRTIGFLGPDLRVYSTPSMVSDIEYCAWRLLGEHLPGGQDSVGAEVHIEHLAATPLGEQVRIAVQVEQVEERRVTFSAEVRDRVELVGRARHTRFVIDVTRHRGRLAAKRERLAAG